MIQIYEQVVIGPFFAVFVAFVIMHVCHNHLNERLNYFCVHLDNHLINTKPCV